MDIQEIESKHLELGEHRIYERLDKLSNLKTFMKYHAFAVWDFMSLLKALQRKLTCVELPWNDSDYDPKIVRLINEIVLAEESDTCPDGTTMSHYSLYLKAMEELGADTSLIKNFTNDLNFDSLPLELRNITRYHLDLAINGEAHEIAASFFYGREKLIPDIFKPIVQTLKKSGFENSLLKYYLERHIELDGDDHGPMALQCIELLIDSEEKKNRVLKVARESLQKREKLWDFILKEIDKA